MKHNYIFFFVLFLIMLGQIRPSIAQECLWSSHAGSTSYDGGGWAVSDRYGNTYITGLTQGDPCFFNTDTLNYSSWFMVKYNSLGQEVWIFDFESYNGSLVGENGIIAMTKDTINDQLLVTGSFFGSLILPDTTLYGQKNTIFLLKMDFDGNIVWCRTAGGPGDDQAFGITYDNNGNIFISGSNEREATFDQITIPKGGFLAEYDAEGTVLWAKNKFRYFDQFGSGSGYPFTEASPNNIKYCNNHLYVYGQATNDSLGYLYKLTFEKNKFHHNILLINNNNSTLSFRLIIDHFS